EELHSIERHVLRFTSGSESQYGFIFGNGVIANFLEVYYQAGPTSPARAAELVAKVIGSIVMQGEFARRLLRRIELGVTVDGKRWAQRDFVAIPASCVEEIGLGFRVFPRAGERLGAFQILGVHTSPLGLVAELPRLRQGRGLRRDRVIDTLAGEV